MHRVLHGAKADLLFWDARSLFMTPLRDPLKNLSQWLLDEKVADAAIFEQIEKEAHDEMQTAVDFAIKAPYPDTSEVDQHVYA